MTVQELIDRLQEIVKERPSSAESTVRINISELLVDRPVLDVLDNFINKEPIVWIYDWE